MQNDIDKEYGIEHNITLVSIKMSGKVHNTVPTH